jgi:hypothetical protein
MLLSWGMGEQSMRNATVFGALGRNHPVDSAVSRASFRPNHSSLAPCRPAVGYARRSLLGLGKKSVSAPLASQLNSHG